MLKRFTGILFILGIMLMPVSSWSQNWEFGALVGGSYYSGDASTEFKVANIRYSFLGFARCHLNKRSVIRVNLGYIRIAGIDSIASASFQRNRNLNFYTDMFELSAQYEYNLLPDKTRGRRIKNRTIPYLFAGLGVNYFAPKTNYMGQSWNLADLQTSGINYSQIAMVFPLGIGVRHYIDPHWLIGFEFGMRFTTTSDLDDIRGNSVYPDPANLPSDFSRLVYDRSNVVPKDPDTGIGYGTPGKQRGWVDGTDIYMVYGITLSYKLGLVRGFKAGRGAVHCPRFF